MSEPPAGVEQLLAEARARLERIAPEDLASSVAAGALLIDIRPAANRLAEGELPGAIVIERNVLEWRLDPTSAHRIAEAADPDRPVVLVCNEGYQSSLAAAALQDLGRRQATDLIGGYRAWQAANGAAPGETDRAARDLAGLREDYRQNGLDVTDLDPDPFAQFNNWFDIWAATDAYDANAMVLATADAAGRPSARYVLLKGVSADGFVFYTNRRSRKGDDLAANPQAALCFGWLDLARQVRVEGSVTEVDDTESDAYFASPTSRQPARRIGLRTERGHRRSCDARGGPGRGDREVRWTRGDPSAALGWLPAPPRCDRVLAGSCQSAARPSALHAATSPLRPAGASTVSPRSQASGPHCADQAARSDVGHDLAGDEAEMVEIVQIEDLEVDPFGADVGEATECLEQFGRRATQCVATELLGVLTDRLGPARHLRVVGPAAHDLRGRVLERAGIAAGLLTGCADASEGRFCVGNRQERQVELARRTSPRVEACAWLPLHRSRSADEETARASAGPVSR